MVGSGLKIVLVSLIKLFFAVTGVLGNKFKTANGVMTKLEV